MIGESKFNAWTVVFNEDSSGNIYLIALRMGGFAIVSNGVVGESG